MKRRTIPIFIGLENPYSLCYGKFEQLRELAIEGWPVRSCG